ncbi:MAG: hypothetical protein ACOH5I_21170 [Oligoflexus sp.]
MKLKLKLNTLWILSFLANLACQQPIDSAANEQRTITETVKEEDSTTGEEEGVTDKPIGPIKSPKFSLPEPFLGNIGVRFGSVEDIRGQECDIQDDIVVSMDLEFHAICVPIGNPYKVQYYVTDFRRSFAYMDTVDRIDIAWFAFESESEVKWHLIKIGRGRDDQGNYDQQVSTYIGSFDKKEQLVWFSPSGIYEKSIIDVEDEETAGLFYHIEETNQRIYFQHENGQTYDLNIISLNE